MESLLPAPTRESITKLVRIAQSDAKAELEVKVLAGQLQTKDEADRVVAALSELTSGGYTETHRATFSYSDGLRVHVTSPEQILKVCSSGSFRGVPLEVERKTRYSEISGEQDVVDIPDLKLRVTLRQEEPLRRDFSGSPMDPKNHIRILNRRTWRSADGLLQIDMSLVKSKTKSTKSLADILKQTPSYELELEVLNSKADPAAVVRSLLQHAEAVVGAYQQSPFLLTESDMQRYKLESDASRIPFLNPVTIARRHLMPGRPNSILSGYTVTNKADGERCMLMVMRDRRLIRWTRKGTFMWTGLTANDDTHLGDVVDGEYIAERNLFCIFDIYVYRTKKVDRLPLMTSDEDVLKEPTKSRLGCARLFLQSLAKDFSTAFAKKPFRIETKLFLAGDGPAMEKAIAQLLDTQFEYPTDGLIFTPRASAVGPVAERKGSTWTTVYKWKPPIQNSIDFLVKLQPGEAYDPVLDKPVRKGTLYVARNPGTDILYPCETLTGEYKVPELPLELKYNSADRVPSPFQPSTPRAPEASELLVPVDAKGIPVDMEGKRVEDTTIIECSRDTVTNRWNVLRTRYDKTYQLRVKGEPQFGNDIWTAEDIWTNIHSPITEEMMRSVSTVPVDDLAEDTLYYKDTLESRDRAMKDVLEFHNTLKKQLYKTYVKKGTTLLELAVGRGNDLHKWRLVGPSKVVGIDLSESNLSAPRQGACVRYLQTQRDSPKEKLPPVLFLAADMTQSLETQDNRYLRLLLGKEPPSTPYLEQFAGLSTFDAISCQFAIHYACGSEETFRTFVGNLTAHGTGMFFGTCMDGQAVYSLLLGTTGHLFRGPKTVWGEFRKDYAEGEGWTEEFGKQITVKLESFERPVQEYLVPWGKVVEILKENGYELVQTTMFGDAYANQSRFTFEAEHQAFSFLHRSFAFKRVETPKPKEEPAVASQEVKVPTLEAPEGKAEGKAEETKEGEEAEAKTEEKPKTIVKGKRLAKLAVPEGPEPVLFSTDLPDFKEFSTGYDAPMQIDGVTFPTVEHYLQWSKAKQFGDAEAQSKIMKTASAKSVKSYGDKVKDVKEDEWAEKRDAVMATALKAKFMQHPELKAKLLSTDDRPIGEANARDKYWSIGTGADTSKAKVPSKWPGKNRLGHLLMDLRRELKE
jgi:ribA/ribD-fused uncharacterized protein